MAKENGGSDERTEETREAEEQKPGLLSKVRSEFSFIRGNFLVLALSWLVMDLASEMPSTYYGLYVKALGGSASIIGLIGSVSMVSQALVQIPGGYLADKYGRRWLISTMTFGIALSQVFYAFAPSWQWLMVGAVVQSLCFIYRPALQAIIADSLPADRRGMGFSIITLINSVSTTPSPLIAGWLFQAYGLVPSVRMGFTFVLIAFLIAGVIRLRLKETVVDPPKIDLGEMVGSIPEAIRESIAVWGKVPRSAFALFTTDVLLMGSISIFMPIMVLYIVEDLGIPEMSWAIILTSLFVSMIVLSIPCGKIIDKYGKKRPPYRCLHHLDRDHPPFRLRRLLPAPPRDDPGGFDAGDPHVCLGSTPGGLGTLGAPGEGLRFQQLLHAHRRRSRKPPGRLHLRQRLPHPSLVAPDRLRYPMHHHNLLLRQGAQGRARPS